MNGSISIVIPLLILFVLDLVVIIKSRRDGSNTKAQNLFLALGICVLLQQGISAVGYSIEVGLLQTGGSTLAYMMPVLGISMVTVAFYFWFRYLITILEPEKHFSSILELVFALPALILVCLAVSSPWTNLLFSVSADHTYHNTGCTYVQSLCPALYSLLALGWLVKSLISDHSRSAVKSLKFFCWFLLPAVAGCLMQWKLGRGGYSQMGISMGLVLIYIEQYMDELFEVRRLKSIAAINDNLEMAYKELNRQMNVIKALNEELEVARREAETANKAKTVFLNNMSHDIRTPLNAILGFTNLMEKDKANVSVVSDYLKKVRKSGDYLMSLINDVLDLAQIESGNQQLELKPGSVSFIQDSLVPMVREMLSLKRLSFAANVDVQHPNVMLDMVKAQQVVMNMVSNAIKYTPEGGTISLSVQDKPSDREGYCKYIISVTDSGIGMSSEFVTGLMEYFQCKENSEAKRVPGIGLGMAIMKTLVDLMQGTIEVKSQLGKGSTFTVTLEHEIVSDPSLIEKPMHDDIDLSVLQGKRILMAEDNDLNAEIASAILLDAGLLLERAEDGAICVNMLNEATAGYYDLVLMDIQMPNMNGYEASVAIRALEDKAKANIPILAMTANAFEEDKKKAFDSGMNGHLSKPIDIPVLMKALVDVLK